MGKLIHKQTEKKNHSHIKYCYTDINAIDIRCLLFHKFFGIKLLCWKNKVDKVTPISPKEIFF